MSRRMVIGAVAIAALVVMMALQEPPDDPSATLACEQWQSVQSDIDAGVLTYDELRAELADIRDLAAGDPDVQQAATDVLAAITQRDEDAARDAGSDMRRACR